MLGLEVVPTIPDPLMTRPTVKYVAIISDLLLWGVILLVILGGLWLIRDYLLGPRFRHQVITLYFDDVSQLKTGSPVRFMGVDVGYVTKVIPAGERIKVLVQTKAGTVEIPKGSHFTIQFNGLAGAKTLEVLPPHQEDLTRNEYITDAPFRLKDVIHANQVYNSALESASNNTYKSLGYFEDEEAILKKLKNMNDNLFEWDRTLVYVYQMMHGEQDILHSSLASGTQDIDTFNQTLSHWYIATNPGTVYTNMKSTMRYINYCTKDLNDYVMQAKQQGKIELLRNSLAQFQLTTTGMNNKAEHTLGSTLNWLNGMQKFASDMEQTLGKYPLEDQVHSLEKQSGTWQEQSQKAEDAI